MGISISLTGYCIREIIKVMETKGYLSTDNKKAKSKSQEMGLSKTDRKSKYKRDKLDFFFKRGKSGKI